MKHLIYIGSAAILAVMMSGCAVFNPQRESKTVTVKGSEATVVDNKTSADKTTAKTPAKKQPQTAADSRHESATSKKHAADKTAALADQLAGEWQIVSVDGKPLPALDDVPYIMFDKRDNRFYCSNGCNVLNGGWRVNADGRLEFSNSLSTMKYCADMGYDVLISSALDETKPADIKIERLGHETYLKFFNAKGGEIFSARKHNMEFLNGNWQIVSVGGKEINDEEATIFIDIAELKVHGNTGCNYFNGELFINPAKSNAIDFSRMATTRMACPKYEQEGAILLALEETASAIEGDAGHVILLNGAGKELMVLRHLDVAPQE